MDYEGLKRKWSGSARKTTGTPKRLVAVLTAVVACAAVAIYFLYKPSDTTQQLLNELSPINPATDTRNLIIAERCTTLTKSSTEWTVTDCKDDLTIHLIFVQDGGYFMRVCGNWDDGMDVFQNAKGVLTALGLNTNCDASTISFLRMEDSTSVYNVCGSNLYLKGGCIV